MNNPIVAWGLALAAPIIWGSTYFVTQKWLVGVHPLWLAALRTSIPALFMCWFVPISVWKRFGIRLLVMSFLNITLFTGLLFLAITRLPGGVAATLVSTLPLQVILLRMLMGIKAEPQHLIAAIGGVVGVALLLLQSIQVPDFLGVIAALAAAFVMAVGVLMTAKYGAGIPSLQLTAAQISLGALVLLSLALWSGEPFPLLSNDGILAMIWLGPIGMGFAYWAWFRAMTYIPITRLAFFGLLNPVVAVLAGIFLMNERLSYGQIIGMFIVISCILFAQKPRRRNVPEIEKSGIKPADTSTY
jgi:probable blue pigment (indigoidine) exporter